MTIEVGWYQPNFPSDYEFPDFSDAVCSGQDPNDWVADVGMVFSDQHLDSLREFCAVCPAFTRCEQAEREMPHAFDGAFMAGTSWEERKRSRQRGRRLRLRQRRGSSNEAG